MRSLIGSSGPVSSQVFPEVQEAAKSICRMGLKNCTDPRVTDLNWGHESRGGINQRGGAYFVLNVDKQNAENGFFIQCATASRVNLKLVLFNSSGEALFEQDANVSQSLSDATLYFTNFDTGSPAIHSTRGGAVANLTAHSGIASAEAADPVVSMCESLGRFGVKKNTIAPGHYLVCVQCATLLSRTNFSVYAVRANNDERLVKNLLSVDRKVQQCGKDLAVFKDEYIKAKTAYQAVLQKASDEEKKLADLLDRRDFRYSEFVDSSMKESGMPPRSAAKPEGWLSRHISIGKNAIESIVKSPSQTSIVAVTAAPPTKPPKPQRPMSVPNPNRSTSLASAPPARSSAQSSVSQSEKRPASVGGGQKGGAKVIERFIYTGEEDGESVTSGLVTPSAPPAPPAPVVASVVAPVGAATEYVQDDFSPSVSHNTSVSDFAPSESEATADEGPVQYHHAEQPVEEFTASVPTHVEEPVTLPASELEPVQEEEAFTASVSVHTAPQPEDEFSASQPGDQSSISSIEPSPRLHGVLKTFDSNDWESGSLQSLDSGVVVEKPHSHSSTGTHTPTNMTKHVHWSEESFPTGHSSPEESAQVLSPDTRAHFESAPSIEEEEFVVSVPQTDDFAPSVSASESESAVGNDDFSPSVSSHQPTVDVDDFSPSVSVPVPDTDHFTPSPSESSQVHYDEPTFELPEAEDDFAPSVSTTTTPCAAAAVVEEKEEFTASESAGAAQVVEEDAFAPSVSVPSEGNEIAFESDRAHARREQVEDDFAPSVPAVTETSPEVQEDATLEPATVSDDEVVADAEVSPPLSEEEEGYEKIARNAHSSVDAVPTAAVEAPLVRNDSESVLVLNDVDSGRIELTPPPVESPPLASRPPPALASAAAPVSATAAAPLVIVEPELSHSMSVSPSPTPATSKASKNKKKKNNKKNKRKGSVKASDVADAEGDEEADEEGGDAEADGSESPVPRATSFSVSGVDDVLIPEQVLSPSSPIGSLIVEEEATQAAEPEQQDASVLAALEEEPIEKLIEGASPSPITVPEVEAETQDIIGYTEEPSLDYSVDASREHDQALLDTTLDTSADFADALEPPVPRAWEAHPSAKDQTAIPMVWDLPGVAASAAQVGVVETKESSVEAPVEAVVEEEPVENTAEPEISPKTRGKGKGKKGKGNKQANKVEKVEIAPGSEAEPVKEIPVEVEKQVVPDVIPVPVSQPEPVQQSRTETKAVPILQRIPSVSSSPQVTNVKQPPSSSHSPVEDTFAASSSASVTSGAAESAAVTVPAQNGSKETSFEFVDFESTVIPVQKKKAAPEVTVDPFASISSDPFASSTLLTPTEAERAETPVFAATTSDTSAVFTPTATSGGSFWDTPSSTLTPARTSIYEEDDGGDDFAPTPVQRAPQPALSLSTPVTSPTPSQGLSQYMTHTPVTHSWATPGHTPSLQHAFSSPYTPTYPRTPSTNSSIKANKKYLEMSDPFAGI